MRLPQSEFVLYKGKKKATIFRHGLCLKLQACGAVYMKQILNTNGTEIYQESQLVGG